MAKTKGAIRTIKHERNLTFGLRSARRIVDRMTTVKDIIFLTIGKLCAKLQQILKIALFYSRFVFRLKPGRKAAWDGVGSCH
jgi:hypothetical protein